MATSMEVDGSSDGTYGGYRNRLGLEKSPYLLQHANDPVNWYSWGEEAFEKARRENKLIFLSTGYYACHWCHLMQNESFENKEISQLLNDNFVSIKLDREERPDVDHLYMLFVQATQGGGGWPLSAWLTPDRKPIVGGTYFPPEDRYFGRPGFKNILLQIMKAYSDDKGAVLKQGEEVLEELDKAIKFRIEKGSELPNHLDVVKNCFTMMDKKYDATYGGFGRAPKFPQPVYLEFMFRKYASDPESETGKKAKEIGLESLRKMVLGGIYDHVGKGFHRYSTDAEWHLPYFEKMLYDQAQLAMVYASAYQISKDPLFERILREILLYVNDCLSNKEGGFYSAEDADSLPIGSTEKREGAFYVWTYKELFEFLDTPVPGKPDVTDGHVFAFHYEAQKNGNIEPFKDPHAELAHQNVLIVRGDVKKTAENFGLSDEDTEKILESARQKLHDVRKTKRQRPNLDNKILTSWNGLMISGLARAAQVLNDRKYLDRALETIEFLHSKFNEQQNNRLLRCWYFDSTADKMVTGPNPIPGSADDYALLINGLLDTYEACFDDKLLHFAERLQIMQDDLFWDEKDYGYFMTARGNEKDIVMRLKDGEDGDEPSSNSISCRNLLRLALFLRKPEFTERAVKLMTSFSNRLQNMPMAVSEMVGALMFHSSPPKQIIICGDLKSDDTQALLQCINSHYLPNKVIIVFNSETHFLRERVPVLSSLQKVDDKATAYICENFETKQRVNTVEELEKFLV